MYLDVEKEVLELKYYSDLEINLGTLLYEINNCWLRTNNSKLPIKVNTSKWPNIDTKFTDFEIISVDRRFGKEEGEVNIRFVIKVADDYYEFYIFISSWDGPMHEGPTRVYPKQTIIYVTEENL